MDSRAVPRDEDYRFTSRARALVFGLKGDTASQEHATPRESSASYRHGHESDTSVPEDVSAGNTRRSVGSQTEANSVDKELDSPRGAIRSCVNGESGLIGRKLLSAGVHGRECTSSVANIDDSSCMSYRSGLNPGDSDSTDQASYLQDNSVLQADLNHLEGHNGSCHKRSIWIILAATATILGLAFHMYKP